MAVVWRVLGAGRHVGKSCNLALLGSSGIIVDCGLQFSALGSPEQFPALHELFEPTLIARTPIARTGIARTDIARTGVASVEGGLSGGLFADWTCLATACVITHHHYDHLAALPVLTEILGFGGPILMSRGTLALGRSVLADCWRTQQNGAPANCAPEGKTTGVEGEQTGPLSQQQVLQLARQAIACGDWASLQSLYPLFSISDEMLQSCLAKVRAVDFNARQQLDNGLAVTLIPAGHVPGAAAAVLECRETRILYTGDYTSSPECFNEPLRIPSGCLPLDLLVSESTYCAQIRDHRPMVEAELALTVEAMLSSGGHVLIPASALASQSLALFLALHFLKTPERQRPRLALVGSHSVESWNALVDLFRVESPPTADWDSAVALVQPLNQSEALALLDLKEERERPTVFFAAPKELSFGCSLALLSRMVQDSSCGVICVGFAHHQSVAFDLIEGKKWLTLPGAVDPLSVKCKFRYLSLGAHDDALGIFYMAKSAAAAVNVLVHGAYSCMTQTACFLRRRLNRPVLCPANGERILVKMIAPARREAQLLVDALAAACGEDALTTLRILCPQSFAALQTALVALPLAPPTAAPTALECQFPVRVLRPEEAADLSAEVVCDVTVADQQAMLHGRRKQPRRQNNSRPRPQQQHRKKGRRQLPARSSPEGDDSARVTSREEGAEEGAEEGEL